MKQVAVTVLTGLLIAGAAWAEEGHGNHSMKMEETKIVPQTTCPVMGGMKINKDVFIDHDGKRIYVCCKGCVEKVKKAPEKYINKLAEKGEVPVSVPEKPKHEDMKPRAEPTGHAGHQH